MHNNENLPRSKQDILKAISECQSIEQLFSIVRQEKIELRMQSLCSASCIPPNELTFTQDSAQSPLDRLKAAVYLAAEINL